MSAATVDAPKVNGLSSNSDSHHLQASIKGKETARSHRTVNLPTTYPSQALRFLERVGTEDSTSDKINHTQPSPQQATVKLNVVIVGAGLCGLSLAVALSRRGHTVQLLEQASLLGEVRKSVSFLKVHACSRSYRLVRAFRFLPTLDDYSSAGMYFSTCTRMQSSLRAYISVDGRPETRLDTQLWGRISETILKCRIMWFTARIFMRHCTSGRWSSACR